MALLQVHNTLCTKVVYGEVYLGETRPICFSQGLCSKMRKLVCAYDAIICYSSLSSPSSSKGTELAIANLRLRCHSCLHDHPLLTDIELGEVRPVGSFTDFLGSLWTYPTTCLCTKIDNFLLLPKRLNNVLQHINFNWCHATIEPRVFQYRIVIKCGRNSIWISTTTSSAMSRRS